MSYLACFSMWNLVRSACVCWSHVSFTMLPGISSAVSSLLEYTYCSWRSVKPRSLHTVSAFLFAFLEGISNIKRVRVRSW